MLAPRIRDAPTFTPVRGFLRFARVRDAPAFLTAMGRIARVRIGDAPPSALLWCLFVFVRVSHAPTITLPQCLPVRLHRMGTSKAMDIRIVLRHSAALRTMVAVCLAQTVAVRRRARMPASFCVLRPETVGFFAVPCISIAWIAADLLCTLWMACTAEVLGRVLVRAVIARVLRAVEALSVQSVHSALLDAVPVMIAVFVGAVLC